MNAKRNHFPLLAANVLTIQKAQGGTFREVVYHYKRGHSNQETRQRLVAKYLKKNFLRGREATEYIYANIPKVNFSVDNSQKCIVGLDF